MVCLFSCASTGRLPAFNSAVNLENYGDFTYLDIPFEFDGGVYPTVVVTMQGRDFRFHIDLGDEKGQITLEKAQLDLLNVTYTDGRVTSTDHLGRMNVARLFRIGGVSLKGLKIIELIGTEDTTRMPAYLQNIGRIGYGFFGAFSLLVDYHARVLTICKPGTIPDGVDLSSWDMIPLNDSPVLSFNAVIAGLDRELCLGLDTGTIMLKKSVVENLLRIDVPDAFIKKQEIAYIDGNTRYPVLKGLDVKTSGSVLADLDFVHLHTEQPRNRDGLLGGDFFQKYKVFIDRERNLLYVMPH
jgi:hypothetical protein